MEKVVVRISLFQSSVTIIQKPSHRFAPYISRLVSIQWQYWYKSESGCLVKVNINLQIHLLVFINISIFHFSVSCLEKNYGFCLKVAKALLSMIFKCSMISAQNLPLKAVFYRFYDVICRHCESIVLLKRLATRLQHVLLVFSRSKWSMKIQRGNQCIMLFKWEWCDLLLLDTKENANL